MASRVSVSVPIWLTFTRIEFAVPVSIPRLRNFVFVTNKSSPTSCSLSPSLSVINGDDRVFLAEVAVELDHFLGGALRAVRFFENVLFGSRVVELARGGIE